MTIHDAKVEITCDGPHCPESIFVEPEFTYGGLGHQVGHYDVSDRALNEKVLAEGWTFRKVQLPSKFHHYCEDCNPTEVFDGHGEGER